MTLSFNYPNSQIEGLRIQNLSSDPSAGNAGRLIFNTTSNELKFDNGTSFITLSTGSSGITGTLTSGEVVYATSTSTVDSDAQFQWSTSNKIFTLGDGGATKTRMVHNAGSGLAVLGTGEYAYEFECTMPSSANAETAVLWTVNDNGSGTVDKIGFQLKTPFTSYTSAGSVITQKLLNQNHGSGANLKLATQNSAFGVPPLGNTCLFAAATAGTSGVGTNVAIYGEASGGDVSIAVGVVGKSVSTNPTAPQCGVIGVAANGSTNTGGFFALSITDHPTLVSAALVADNGTSTSPIFLARDNGSTVVTIADGGAVTCTGNVTSNLFIASTFTSQQVLFYSASGHIIGDSGMTYDLSTNTLSVDEIVLGGTSANQIVFENGSGNLDGSANLTYNGTTLTATAETIVASDSGFAVRNTSGTEGLRAYILRQTTTNTATPIEMSIDNSNSIFLPTLADGDTYYYEVNIGARGTAGTNDNSSSGYKRTFVISRIGSTTAIVGTVLGTDIEDIAGWDVTVTADDTNDRPAVKVTGDAATTISWTGWATAVKIS